MLLNYKPQHRVNNNRRNGVLDAIHDGEEETVYQTEISFLQADTAIPGTYDVVYENIKFFACNKMDHYTSTCNEPGTEDGVQMLKIHTSHAAEEDHVSNSQFLQNDPKYK